MSEYHTVFGSLAEYAKGGVDVLEDDPKNYVFSNVFEVAGRAEPYERVCVAKNFEYVIEAVRAEGTSPWYAAAHDEFALCMDGRVELHLVRLDDPHAVVGPGSRGARRLEGLPTGRKMGRIVLGRGHQALIPVASAYHFQAERPGVLLIQTLHGPVTVEKWAEICQTS